MPDIELAGSFIIGGMLLLSILSLNADIMETATINSLGTIAQKNATVVVSILETGTVVITDLSDTTIKFLADVDDDGSVEEISYYLGPKSEPSDTDNPNDRYLYRSVDGAALDVALGLISWNLTYFDSNGAATITPADVRTIRISFTVETVISFDERYGSARWEGRFSPKNMRS